MTIINDLNTALNDTIDNSNFAEEVDIIAENKSGQNYSLYTVKNKNGTTFQNVPGGAGIEGKGFLGFVGGDKSRPAMIGVTAPTIKATSTASAPSWPLADIT